HFGCRTAVVVRGYRGDAIDVAGARFVDNPDFATTGEAYSLALAEADLAAGTLVAFGDIVVKRHIVQALLEEATAGITIAVDSAPAIVASRRPCSNTLTGRIRLCRDWKAIPGGPCGGCPRSSSGRA